MPYSTATVVPSAAIWASDRSTKMTPRSTTCTPRYAWIPVRMRLAMNGARRNCNTSIQFSYAERKLLRFGKGLRELIDIIVEQLKIIVHFFHTAYRRQQDQHLPAGLLCNRVRGAQIEIGLHQN